MAPASSVQIIPVCSASDGDRSRWPERGLSNEDPTHYMHRLATKYMQERGQDVKGQKYSLDRLPHNYALFGKKRGNDDKHIDRYLYGHPKYTFRSPEEFFEHFKCLMDTGSTATCICKGCTGGRTKRPRTDLPSSGAHSARSTTKHDLARKSTKSAARHDNVFMETPLRSSTFPRPGQRSPTPEYEKVDEEGCPDVYRHLVDQLSVNLTMDQPIEEPYSFDWQINRKSIKPTMDGIARQPSFLPRCGEIVMFVRGLTPSQLISCDKVREEYVIWDAQQEVTLAMPQWEAGIVTDVPTESITVADLVLEQPKSHQINYSGFRIEPLSAPNSKNKHWSKRVATVRLNEMRPLAMYLSVLNGVAPKDYHPTVIAALTVMSSFSLFEKYHFKGVWPTASVYSRAVFLGSEFITVGDTVRLTPSPPDQDQCWDVLKVTAIKLKMFHLDTRGDSEYELADERWNDCSVQVDGIAFTRDQRRAWGMGKLPLTEDDSSLPKCLQGYGEWYRLHGPTTHWKIPLKKIIGRCYEAEAVKLWFASVEAAPKLAKTHAFAPINSTPGIPDSVIPAAAVDISRGLKDVITAREFSKHRDTRIGNGSWFWAEHRVEQLDLEEVKGQAVKPFVYGEPIRDVRAWKRATKIREKGAGHKAKPDLSNVSYGLPANDAGLLAASAAGATAGRSENDASADEDERMSN